MIEGTEPAQTKDQKQKLTLTINRDVIDKAKAQGINISAITEQLLRAVTYQPTNGNTMEDVLKAYSALFSEAQAILNQYPATVTVGEGYDVDEEGNLYDEYEVILNPVRLLKKYKNINDWKDVSVSEVSYGLYEPDRIINNLIQEITKAAKLNKQKINELKFALHSFKLFSDEIRKEMSSDKSDNGT